MKYQVRGFIKSKAALNLALTRDCDTQTEAQNIGMDFIGLSEDRHATITRWSDNKLVSTIRQPNWRSLL